MYVTESGNGGLPECTETVTFFRIVECWQRKSLCRAKRQVDEVRRQKETSDGAGVRNTELQISKSRISEAPAQAFFNSVFSPLLTFGNAVCGRAASGKRRRRHCHYLIMLRYAMTSPAVAPLWSFVSFADKYLNCDLIMARILVCCRN